MSSYNRAVIVGRLGADPEIRDANGTPVATLSVATSEVWKDRHGEKQERTEWHRCILWDRTAEVAEEYLRKGDLVLIEGKLQTRKWQDKDGVDRYTTEIRADRMQMLQTQGSEERSSSRRDDKPRRRDDDDEPRRGRSERSSRRDESKSRRRDEPSDGGLGDLDDDIPF